MICHYRRYISEGWFYNSYCLDAKLDLTDEERKLVDMHDLGQHIIVESVDKEEYQQRTQDHLDNMDNSQPGWLDSAFNVVVGVVAVTWYLGSALVTATFSTLQLSVTLQELIDGTHIEADNDADILMAERFIIRAVEVLEARLPYLSTFDNQDRIYEIDRS